MTEQEFEDAMENCKLDDEYAEYIMEHRSVGNGEVLIRLMERGELYEDFKDKMVTQ